MYLPYHILLQSCGKAYVWFIETYFLANDSKRRYWGFSSAGRALSQKALIPGFYHQHHTNIMVTCVSHINAQEVETGGPEVQGHLWLYNESDASSDT